MKEKIKLHFTSSPHLLRSFNWQLEFKSCVYSTTCLFLKHLFKLNRSPSAYKILRKRKFQLSNTKEIRTPTNLTSLVKRLKCQSRVTETLRACSLCLTNSIVPMGNLTMSYNQRIRSKVVWCHFEVQGIMILWTSLYFSHRKIHSIFTTVYIFMNHTKTSRTSSICYKMSFYDLAHILTTSLLGNKQIINFKEKKKECRRKKKLAMESFNPKISY